MSCTCAENVSTVCPIHDGADDIEVPLDVPLGDPVTVDGIDPSPTVPIISDEFTIASRGRIFLGRETLNALGIDGAIGTGEIAGTSVTVYMEMGDRFFGMGMCGKYLHLPTELQRDGEITLPVEAREYFDVRQGDDVWLTIIGA